MQICCISTSKDQKCISLIEILDPQIKLMAWESPPTVSSMETSHLVCAVYTEHQRKCNRNKAILYEPWNLTYSMSLWMHSRSHEPSQASDAKFAKIGLWFQKNAPIFCKFHRLCLRCQYSKQGLQSQAWFHRLRHAEHQNTNRSTVCHAAQAYLKHMENSCLRWIGGVLIITATQI